MPIVAEGIENEEALAVLRKLGELKGQGYHYGKPEDAEATLRRLTAGEVSNAPATESKAKRIAG